MRIPQLHTRDTREQCHTQSKQHQQAAAATTTASNTRRWSAGERRQQQQQQQQQVNVWERKQSRAEERDIENARTQKRSETTTTHTDWTESWKTKTKNSK